MAFGSRSKNGPFCASGGYVTATGGGDMGIAAGREAIESIQSLAARFIDSEQIGRPGGHRQDAARGEPFRRGQTDRFHFE